MNEAEGYSGLTSGKDSGIDAIYSVVSSEFLVEDYFLEQGVLTFQVQLTPNSKEAFLRLMEKLEPFGLIPVLKKIGGKNVLRTVPKPKAKPSDIRVNILLFLATIATTYLTGYFVALDVVRDALEMGGINYPLDPFVGAAMFTVAIMTVLGVHEFGHTLAAKKHRVEASFPYFIPGPPPQLGGLGTFGAVIMQKSLPPNKDALFDLGAAGPIAGFIMSIIASVVGLSLSPVVVSQEVRAALPSPVIFDVLIRVMPLPSPVGVGYVYVLLHPVAFAGWIGMLVTMLNLLPVGSLDGGHVARSLFSDRARPILFIISVLILLLTPYFAMIFFVVLFSMYRHPGPLDDASTLSQSRKLVAAALAVIFFLTLPLPIRIF